MHIPVKHILSLLLREGLTLQPGMIWNKLFNTSQPRTHNNPPVPASQVLGIGACTPPQADEAHFLVRDMDYETR